MIPMSHLSFVQCEQVKFQPKKKVKMKVSHSVVAVGMVAAGGGGGGGGSAGRGGGGDSCHVKHDMNFCNFFNLLSFTISNKA